jgi:hypothetical protein
MYQNPAIQLQLAREREHVQTVARQTRIEPRPVESVLDSIVRRLRQLVGRRPLQPLVRGAA